jgi:hypothetical protein
MQSLKQGQHEEAIDFTRDFIQNPDIPVMYYNS